MNIFKKHKPYFVGALIIVLVLIGTLFDSETYACAPRTNGQALSSSGLYDGLPSAKVSLVPENNEWKLVTGYAKDGYYLGCFYGKESEPLSVKIPDSAETCVAEGINITCK